jgi:F0F1-type ATP synthase assembly protein I
MTKKALISTGAGILVGAVAGYLYYRYIGCDYSGTCVIIQTA